MSTEPSAPRPSTVLRDEHQVILRVIGVLRRLVDRYTAGQSFEHDSFRECVGFYRFFADACHHAKEEDLLFPALEERGMPREGGPIGVMLYEHQVARELTRRMGEALDRDEAGETDAKPDFVRAAEDYIELLTNHIDKEDNVLFTMGDHVLSPDDQKTLCTKFCEVGCRAFGGKTREQLQKIADELEARWPAS